VTAGEPLKADLHLHTREGDPFIAYDAYALIARAAREGYEVLSITNHDRLTFSERLEAYAAERGILLVPGVEATIEGRHVLLYNFDVSLSMLRTFADLRRFKGPDWLVVAPHPFFPASFSLGSRLLRELDLFDAIELSHFYTRWIDFNRRAVRLARATGRALVGSSDSHLIRQFGTTYSVIEGEPTVFSVLSAIRNRRVRVVSHGLTLPNLLRTGTEVVVRDWWGRLRGRRREPVPEPPRRLARSR
jgi:predicted metal-dependent phosphoesterase TrpH